MPGSGSTNPGIKYLSELTSLCYDGVEPEPSMKFISYPTQPCIRSPMRKIYLIIGCLCLLAFAAMPAQAFTARSLTITLSQNGDAQADMQYELSWTEQIAVFFRLADPAGQLKNGLENELGRPVTVTSFTSSTADVTIPSFAYASGLGTSRSLVTPAFTFSHIQEAVNKYWFARFISPNFTPRVTTIIFPDGFRAVYYDRTNIPTVAHRLAA